MPSSVKRRLFATFWWVCCSIGIVLFSIAAFIFFLPAWLADTFDL